MLTKLSLLQMSAALDELAGCIGMATEVGVSAKYAKKVLKRLQRQLEPQPQPLAAVPTGNDSPRVPAPEKPREPREQQEQKPAAAEPQPPTVPRSRTPVAAAPQPARGTFLGQQLLANGPAWGGAAAQAPPAAAAAGKGPRPPATRPMAPNGPLPLANAQPPPPPPKLIQQEHSWEPPPPPLLLPVPGTGPAPSRLPPPPPPPVHAQVRTMAPLWQQQQQPQPHPAPPGVQPGSLYSQPLTARAIPQQQAPAHFTGPRPLQAPLQPGSWGSAPGTPVSWQDANLAATQRGPFGGPQAGGMGSLQQQHPQLGPAGVRGMPTSTQGVHALQPPPPQGPPRRSTDFAQQGLLRQGSLGRRSLESAGSLSDAVGPFHGNGTPRAAVDLGSGSSLFAHPVFPAGSLGLSESLAGGTSGESTPHSARTVGSLAFGGKPGSGLGGFGSGAFGPFPSALPVPEAAGALDRMAQQQPRRDDLQPAPLQLTQSHFGPTVSANGPQGAQCLA